MAPPEVSPAGNVPPSRRPDDWPSEHTNISAARACDDLHGSEGSPSVGAKRPRGSNTGGDESEASDYLAKRHMASASKPVKSLAPSLAPAASAAASGSSLAFSEAPYYGMNPSTPAVISDDATVSDSHPVPDQLVYAGSFHHVQTVLSVATEEEAELLASYKPCLTSHGGHQINLTEVFRSKFATERDGRDVGWVINGTFNHLDQFGAIMKDFKAQDIRIVSRRIDTSRPFLFGTSPGTIKHPPVPVVVFNFKVFCKDRLKEIIAGRLSGMKSTYVPGPLSTRDDNQETVSGDSSGAARALSVSSPGQRGKKTTKTSNKASELLHKACNSLLSADDLEPFGTPAAMKVPLHEHQQTALCWMRGREHGKPLNDVFVQETRGPNSCPAWVDVISGTEHQQRPGTESGGILADIMGLGKTVTAVSFVLAGMEDARAWATDFGPDSGMSRSMATLLVVPPSLISHWESEIRTKTTLSPEDLYVHFGPGRDDNGASCANAKIVLTSSSLVSLAGKRDSDMLFNTHWHRAMFDEAHEFRNPETRLAKNVLRIEARFRWAITGTPIHNYVSDIQPILQLINARPVASRADFNKHVSALLRKDPANGGLALRLLASTYMIRRKPDQDMFPAAFTYVKADVSLNRDERELYEEARSKVALEIQESKSSVNALSRFHDMRKICAMGVAAKPSMRHAPDQDPKNPVAKYQRLISDGGTSCHACGEVPSLDSVLGDWICSILPCAQEHVLCSVCYVKESGRCPCEDAPAAGSTTRVMRSDLNHVDLNAVIQRDGQMSAKMKFIRDEVKAYPASKFVVMASYVPTVSEIICVLKAEGVSHTRYDGSVSQSARRKNMAAFKENSGIQVLVGTIKSLGEGHSIEQAQRLILVDVEWNPQVSEQAKARVLRLNQQNDATVTQLIAKGTIEDKIWVRAEEKKRLAEVFSDHWDAAQGPVESDLDVIKSWFRN